MSDVARTPPGHPTGGTPPPPETPRSEEQIRIRRQVDEIAGEVFWVGKRRRSHLRRYSILVVLSAAIATLGMLADSSAVVIGAMLISPLMTPILGVAAGIVLARPVRLLESAANVVAGSLATIVVAVVVAGLAGGAVTAANLPAEVVARTSPGLLDLFIAVVAGAAAGYVLQDPEASPSLPGVAIAVALVPPLGAVGVAVEVGAWSEAGGALLAFGTNLVAIVLAAAGTLLAFGVRPLSADAGTRRRLHRGLAATLAAAVVIVVPLAIHTARQVRDQGLRRAVAEMVPVWDGQARILELDAEIVDGVGKVELTVASADQPPPAAQLATFLTGRAGVPIELTVRHLREEEDHGVAR